MSYILNIIAETRHGVTLEELENLMNTYNAGYIEGLQYHSTEGNKDIYEITLHDEVKDEKDTHY